MATALQQDRISRVLVGKPGLTLAENVRQTLLEEIMAGHFGQGDRLYPERLAEQLGVSMTPVREALMQLAAEGFIEVVQRRGFHIRTPDPRQITNLWQVRQGLELTAGELCIARLEKGELTAGDLEQLAGLQRDQEVGVDSIPHVYKLELNNRLHSQIVEFSGNALLVSLYRSIQIKVLGSLVQRGLESWRGRLADESAEHWGIIDALGARDLEAYHKAVRKHLKRSLKDALSDLAVHAPAPTAPEQPSRRKP
jgi:DNA-binding GntR family transcriptional regulator